MSEIENLKIYGGATYTVGNQDIIANEWEVGKTYVKNKSYVVREHRLYVCNVTHTSVEPFDATKWTEITIGDAIANNTTAIGDLSQLTTTDKSSLVGAVNEVNGAITSPTDITSGFITMASGYTFTSGKVYKQGKHIFGNIVINGTLQGGNNVDTVGKINNPYRTAVAVNGFCGISNGAWFTNNIGYIYVSAGGDLQVATTPTGMSYAKIHIDYVTA